MKVGIAGVGGIGSNVAVNLVRCGCTSLKLVDFDRVEQSNLNRQFYFTDQVGGYKVDMLAENLRRINPDASIECLRLKLDRDNMVNSLQDCHILVEGFDEQEAKKMMLEAFAGSDRPLVSASGIAGNLVDNIRMRRLGSCIVVGDLQTDYREAGLYAPKISIVAAMMADIVLEKGGYYE